MRILSAVMKAVRQYGLEGVRVQNVSELAGVSPGALYRYFDGKEQLLLECFIFWTSHPDETVFYYRFRDSAFFPQYDKTRDFIYFKTFAGMVQDFKRVFPCLDWMNQDLLRLHVLTSTVMYARYVVEGVLPNSQETEDTIFQLLATGLSGYMRPGQT